MHSIEPGHPFADPDEVPITVSAWCRAQLAALNIKTFGASELLMEMQAMQDLTPDIAACLLHLIATLGVDSLSAHEVRFQCFFQRHL